MTAAFIHHDVGVLNDGVRQLPSVAKICEDEAIHLQSHGHDVVHRNGGRIAAIQDVCGKISGNVADVGIIGAEFEQRSIWCVAR